jgi:hypothetical protein
MIIGIRFLKGDIFIPTCGNCLTVPAITNAIMIAIKNLFRKIGDRFFIPESISDFEIKIDPRFSF